MEGDMSISESVDSLQIAPTPGPSDPLAALISKQSYQFRSTSSATDHVHLSAEEQSEMTRSVEEIFELEEEADGDEVMNDEEEEVIDLEDQERRTQKLMGVMPVLGRLWWGDDEGLDRAAQKLADGGRDRMLNLFPNSQLPESSYIVSLWYQSALLQSILHALFTILPPCSRSSKSSN